MQFIKWIVKQTVKARTKVITKSMAKATTKPIVGFMLLSLLPLQSSLAEEVASPAIQLVNISNDGFQADAGGGFFGSISGDGNLVVFQSAATNLVLNPESQWTGPIRSYLRDIEKQQTSILTPQGSQIDGSIQGAVISVDGKFVAFMSDADNIVSGDTNGFRDVFVYELATDNTSLVSIASDGTQANQASFIFNISADGRYVMFTSYADNLVSDDTNGKPDLFIYDRQTQQTTRESLATGGEQLDGHSGISGLTSSNQMSVDGRYIVFFSNAANADLSQKFRGGYYLRDRAVNTTKVIEPVICNSIWLDGCVSLFAALSADGKYVAYNAYYEHYHVDQSAPNGRGWYLYDVDNDSHSLIAEDYLGSPSISADGRYVTFSCMYCSGVLPGNANYYGYVYVYDRITEQIELVSKSYDGTKANGHSMPPAISADGSTILFCSVATNLVANDNNGIMDCFLAANPLFDAPSSADLSIASTYAPDPVLAGSDVTYSVQVQNNGINVASNVTLTHTFSDDIVYVSSTHSCDVAGNVVTCTIAELVDGATEIIDIVVQPDMDGILQNDIAVASSTNDPDTSNNTAQVTITVDPAVDLVLELEGTPALVLAGNDFTYTLTVTNVGPSLATNVVLTDTLPAAAPVQSITASKGTCVDNLGVVDCQIGDLQDDEVVTITIVVRPSNGSIGVATNTASVNTDAIDRDLSNNAAAINTTIEQSSTVKAVLKGKGEGVISGDGINCPGICEQSYSRGDTITLTATATGGSSFDRWSGGVCSGKDPVCIITLDRMNMNVQAFFK